jgi:hypothetical protein
MHVLTTLLTWSTDSAVRISTFCTLMARSIIVCTSIYCAIQSYTGTYFLQVRRTRAYLDSLSMDGAEVAVNCLCSVRSFATCWCPDDELANAHRGECEYRRMAAVMEELDAERDRLLDEDGKLVGRVKDVKEVEKRLRQSLLPPSPAQCMAADSLFRALHVYPQGRIAPMVCTSVTSINGYILIYTEDMLGRTWYVLVYTGIYLVCTITS